jgi:hypothetical protein
MEILSNGFQDGWSGFIWDYNQIQEEITVELNCRTGAGTAGWAWIHGTATSATLATTQHSSLSLFLC